MTQIMTGTVVRPKLISQAVAEDIGRRIVAGVYPTGARLPQDEIEKVYDVSRSACREAMANLTAKGLISARPNTGTVVNPQESWNLLDPELISWVPWDGTLGDSYRQFAHFVDRHLPNYVSNLDPLVTHLIRALGTFYPLDGVEEVG